MKRYLIIIPTMMTPYIPAEAGGVIPTYFPTWIEWTVTAGALAFFLLLFTLFSKLFPIVSIWEAHRTAQLATIREWVPESALVARPGLDVEVWRLPAGGYVFLGSLSQGMAMAAAAECAAAATGEFDVAENLAVLLRANVVIALQ